MKAIGVTLLFAEINRGKIKGTKDSFVLKVNSVDDFISQIHLLAQKNIFKRSNVMSFMGIEDIFYVSNILKEYSVVGITPYDEYKTFDSSKKITRSIALRKSGYYLAELIYLVSYDKIKYQAVKISLIINASNKIEFNNKIKSKKLYLSKALQHYMKINQTIIFDYVGTYNLTFISENLIKDQPFESYYKIFSTIDASLMKLLYTPNEIKEQVTLLFIS